jgi:DNA-binding NarL/FixJ family response regulator
MERAARRVTESTSTLRRFESAGRVKSPLRAYLAAGARPLAAHAALEHGMIGAGESRGMMGAGESPGLERRGRWSVSIRVLLVDDHKIVRDGLRSMLAKEMDIEVVGEAESGRSAISLTRETKPTVVIMDISLRELNGIDATRQLMAESPDLRVIALSMHSDRRYVAEMLAAGAAGYLLKDSAFDELATAIRAAAEGRVFLSQRVAGVVVDDYVRHLSGEVADMPASPGRTLSTREREVLQLIAEGDSTKEIANGLHLSVKTIETYRRNIMEKLDIHNIAGLIKYAVREGLASLED